jgi:hypothetical protein
MEIVIETRTAVEPKELLMQMVNKNQTSPVRMKNLIDSLYEKEKKYIYQRQGATRDDFVGV